MLGIFVDTAQPDRQAVRDYAVHKPDAAAHYFSFTGWRVTRSKPGYPLINDPALVPQATVRDSS